MFEWTQLHDKEFEKMKEAVGDHIQLSPFNVSKPVHLHVDASQEGLGYLLSQPLEEEKEDSYSMERQLIILFSMGLNHT